MSIQECLDILYSTLSKKIIFCIEGLVSSSPADGADAHNVSESEISRSEVSLVS